MSILKDIRSELKLEQKDFAAKLGMEQGSISAIETGKARLSRKLKEKLITEFFVSETYLETGELPMFMKQISSFSSKDLKKDLPKITTSDCEVKLNLALRLIDSIEETKAILKERYQDYRNENVFLKTELQKLSGQKA